MSLISPFRSLFYNVTLVKHVFFKHAHTIDIWGSKGEDGENAYPTIWTWNGWSPHIFWLHRDFWLLPVSTRGTWTTDRMRLLQLIWRWIMVIRAKLSNTVNSLYLWSIGGNPVNDYTEQVKIQCNLVTLQSPISHLHFVQPFSWVQAAIVWESSMHHVLFYDGLIIELSDV